MRACLLAGLLAGWPLAAGAAATPSPADKALTAPIVPDARKIGEDRYSSARNFDDTIMWYKRFFQKIGGVNWRTIANLPTIKARHLQNLRKRGDWDGINIYDHDGAVTIYVLRRPPAPAKPAPKHKPR